MMRSAATMLFVVLTTILSAQDLAPGKLVDIVGGSEPKAALRFRVVDTDGKLLPCRLTFIPESGQPRARLFGAPRAAPRSLAVRNNIVYSLHGAGLIAVPPGRYTIWASRGLEWSIAQLTMTLEAGKTHVYSSRLKREVDTTGFLSGDCHLHTLTYSGHGDADLNERIISLIGEGVEFAVATDHNHTTDYRPTMTELGVSDAMHPVRGNEISVPAGHFNVFPVDHWERHPYRYSNDGNQLFKFVRGKKNEEGIVPVIQLNHPRWGNIDYFGKVHLDPITGDSSDPHWSTDFDTIELLNENPNWGFFDADDARGRHMGSSEHHALRDWFNLLNRGFRYAATGNSDSHAVENNFAGFPRNFIVSSTDDPSKITTAEIADAFRNGRCMATSGPFVLFDVNGAASGAEARPAKDGTFEAHIEVRCATWIDCDRVKIVVNGEIIRTLSVPQVPERRVQRLKTTIQLSFDHDSWVALLVEGDDSLAPIVRDKGRPCLPVAIVNPVWIDADGDGTVVSPLATIDSILTQQTTRQIKLNKVEESLLTMEAARRKHPSAQKRIRALVISPDRHQRLAALAAAEALRDPKLLPDLGPRLDNRQSGYMREDAFLDARRLSARIACGAADAVESIVAYRDRHGQDQLARYSETLMKDLGGKDLIAWHVHRYHPNIDKKSLLKTSYPPERDAQFAISHLVDDEPRPWEQLTTNDTGYLDLSTRDEKGAFQSDHKIAYAGAFIISDQEQQLLYMMGSDDGCRIWLNDNIIHENTGQHGAYLTQQIGLLKLRPGPNRLLIKVENGGGGFGLRFRLFGDHFKIQ